MLQRLQRAEIMVIGGSAGSFNPIFQIVKSLKQNFNKAMVIVIHRGKNNYSDIENLFGSSCRISVSEIADKDKVTAGKVYIAPANYHTLFESDKTFALDVSEPVWYSKPSIDVTFESAADVYADKCVGILLSGANHDGANGLLKLKQKGGLTIVQNPADANMDVMPAAAINMNAAEIILNADEILQLINNEGR